MLSLKSDSCIFKMIKKFALLRGLTLSDPVVGTTVWGEILWHSIKNYPWCKNCQIVSPGTALNQTSLNGSKLP